MENHPNAATASPQRSPKRHRSDRSTRANPAKRKKRSSRAQSRKVDTSRLLPSIMLMTERGRRSATALPSSVLIKSDDIQAQAPKGTSFLIALKMFLQSWNSDPDAPPVLVHFDAFYDRRWITSVYDRRHEKRGERREDKVKLSSSFNGTTAFFGYDAVDNQVLLLRKRFLSSRCEVCDGPARGRMKNSPRQTKTFVWLPYGVFPELPDPQDPDFQRAFDEKFTSNGLKVDRALFYHKGAHTCKCPDLGPETAAAMQSLYRNRDGSIRQTSYHWKLPSLDELKEAYPDARVHREDRCVSLNTVGGQVVPKVEYDDSEPACDEYSSFEDEDSDMDEIGETAKKRVLLEWTSGSEPGDLKTIAQWAPRQHSYAPVRKEDHSGTSCRTASPRRPQAILIPQAVRPNIVLKRRQMQVEMDVADNSVDALLHY